MDGRSFRSTKDLADDLLRRFRRAASRLKIDSSLADLSGEPIPPTFPQPAADNSAQPPVHARSVSRSAVI